MRYKLSFVVVGCLAASAVVPLVFLVHGSTAKADPPKQSGRAADTTSLPQEDRPQPFTPKHPRTDADENRVQAAALLATARTMEQRQEPVAALRLYQRAYRLDHNAVAALEEIVPLAFSLNRREESLRYAVKLAEQETSDPDLPRRIGMYLAENGSWKPAIKLLERSVKTMDSSGKPAADRLPVEAELARLDFLAEKFSDAAALFDKVASALAKPKAFGLDEAAVRSLVGEGGLTYELMGDAYLEVGRPDDAAKAFHKLNDLAPNPASLALNLARVDLKAKHPATALDKLQTYFDSHPADLNLAALELLSDVLTELKQSDQFIPRLEKLHKAMPDSIAVAFDLAEQYRKAGKLAEAAPLYEAILTKKPTAEAYRALAAIDRGKDRKEALLKLLGEVAEKTDSLEVLGDEGKSLAADNKLVDSLLDLAEKKHSDAKPANFGPLLAAATLAADRKQFERAGKFYDLAIKADPKHKAELLLAWGLTLVAADKNAEAVKVLQRGVDEKVLSADKPPAFEYYLAGALEMSGKTDAALAVARKMMEKKSGQDLRFLSRPAWILFHAKRYDEAYKAYKDLVEKHDADFSSEENRESLRDARSALSNIAVIQHRLPEAEEWLEQALDEYPDDPGALNDLGYLWADENKQLDRSLAMIQQAVAAEPDNAAYRDSLGWVYYRLGKTDEALAELKKAVTMDENPDPTVLEHYADVLTSAHKAAEARENFERALKGYKKEGNAEKIKSVEEKLGKLNK
ncbi:MAG TPA: tetratricopeptide repeat protein [Pirellulales bacterium]|jgi:tetratricopeptide (TPR) repeat protein|nr:tetratricopeptide repeat protein [Pirellulales bacterium]